MVGVLWPATSASCRIRLFLTFCTADQYTYMHSTGITPVTSLFPHPSHLSSPNVCAQSWMCSGKLRCIISPTLPETQRWAMLPSIACMQSQPLKLCVHHPYMSRHRRAKYEGTFLLVGSFSGKLSLEGPRLQGGAW